MTPFSMHDESTILSTINAKTFKRKERSTIIHRKESTKFLKVGVLYVRFDLANKEQEIIRMYFNISQCREMTGYYVTVKYQAKPRTIT